MYIAVEPAGLMMHTVKLVFDPTDPAAEDQEVRDYLNQHELEPRYHWFAEIEGLEGRECEIMQFGGCYLGRNLQNIGVIQRRVVETELLTAEIGRQIDSGALTALAHASESERNVAIAALIDEFRQEENFGQDEPAQPANLLPPWTRRRCSKRPSAPWRPCASRLPPARRSPCAGSKNKRAPDTGRILERAMGIEPT